MLLRYLTVTGALCLSSCAALSLSRSPSPETDVIPKPPNSRILSHFREIKVPCSESFFTGSSSPFDVTPTAYLNLSFATENGTLLANDAPIFPVDVPIQFHAFRHSEFSQQAVLLTYDLDACPLPTIPCAFLGEVFLLKLKLLDLYGRLASKHLVSISLAKDPAGDLLICEVESVAFVDRGIWSDHLSRPSRLAGGQAASAPAGDNSSSGKTKATTHGAFMDAHRTILPGPQHRPAVYRPLYWMYKGSNMARLLQRALLPVLLGVIAGIVASAVGFLVGRTVIAIHYCFRGSRRERDVVLSTLEEGLPSEKE